MKDGNMMGRISGILGPKTRYVHYYFWYNPQLLAHHDPCTQAHHDPWTLDATLMDAQGNAHKWQIGLKADLMAWASIYQLADAAPLIK